MVRNRVIVYDATCPKLGRVWQAGARFARASTVIAATSVSDMRIRLQELSQIDELQIWAHGSPGRVHIGKQVMTAGGVGALPVHTRSVVWFRTCATFYGQRGKRFARSARDGYGCLVKGHLKNIWLYHGGLVAIRPGVEPYWGDDQRDAGGVFFWGGLK